MRRESSIIENKGEGHIMKIVVLAGGISTEREISIVSGTQVCKALRSRHHRAILIDVFCGDNRIPGAVQQQERRIFIPGLYPESRAEFSQLPVP